ncbi:MAG: ribulose 1,5-bisphosphate carboxylase large subunit [Planctomycetes bacterium]|nr:ribulose 1,5-bisphosphate carboxylase large subunit [Planctomycetota bacterium]
MLELSGGRFRAVYRIAAPGEEEAAAVAAEIAIEQTIEYPADLVSREDIRGQIFGRVESIARGGDDFFDATISYADETAGGDLPQLLNVLYGNSSLKPGIRLERLDLSEGVLSRFRGPRFGRAGLRALLGVPGRPLLATALKPMGLSPQELACLAYQLALGGIDLVKDDHGLADQPFCRFEDRVHLAAEAVARANRETGLGTIYAPNVTAPVGELARRARFACEAGAGALLISPGLAGLDAMRALADDDRIALPLLFHPALLGSFVTCPEDGISPFALFGQIARLAGADASIFPHYGGRFSFSAEHCLSIARGTEEAMGGLVPIFPVPAGGMTLSRVPELVRFYGRDVVLLIGGALHRGRDLVETCRRFRGLVEAG